MPAGPAPEFPGVASREDRYDPLGSEKVMSADEDAPWAEPILTPHVVPYGSPLDANETAYTGESSNRTGPAV